MNGMSKKKKKPIGLLILLIVLVIGIPIAMIAKTVLDNQKEAEIAASQQTEPVAEKPIDWLTEMDCRLSSHRSCTSSVPENTLEGIQQVRDLGFDALEIDPRLSADGTFFLMHDDSVSRTTDGSGNISSMSDEQIKSLNISTSSYPDYADQTLKVPSFEDAVQLISQTDMILNVDGSKGAFNTEEGTDQIMSILKRYDMYERSFGVISDSSVRERVHSAYPDFCLSWLYDPSTSLDANIEEVKNYPRAMLSVKEEVLSDSMLQTLLDSGIYFQVYNVNRSETYDRLKVAGVPMIETDSLVP